MRGKRTVLSAILVAVVLAGAQLPSGHQASAQPADPIEHSLAFDADPLAAEIVVGTKSATAGAPVDTVFRDRLGREVSFRGFNVSGSTKLRETGFTPFRSAADAADSLGQMRGLTGANMVRFLVGWEGVNPAVDTIDYAYLDRVVAQLRAATARRQYALIDWHQDLFTRAVFDADSWHTGNGAPDYVTAGYPREFCGVVCFHWGQHLLTDETVRRAYRDFWNNATFATAKGPRRVQDVFLWQLTEAVRYIKSRVPTAEWPYLIGVDPFNEPADGGMEGLSPASWDNQKLWPFYQRVRAGLDAAGWQDKLVFAEPMVFWNSSGPIKATGGHHLREIPESGFVFNSHFYDTARIGGLDRSTVTNGKYFHVLDQIRDEGRYLGMPVFLSEFGAGHTHHNLFGAQVPSEGPLDPNRIVKAVYQGMEQSARAGGGAARHLDAYTPLVSGTQWQWDLYYDRHHEYMNDDPDQLLTADDAWNGEDFSVVSRNDAGGVSTLLDPANVARMYPRAAQGDVLSFSYNDLTRDGDGELLNWLTVRPGNGNEYFGDSEFALLTWRGRKSEAPTEVFLPPAFDPATSAEPIVVVTDQRIVTDPGLAIAPASVPNEVLLTVDPGAVSSAGTGRRLVIWDDPDPGETAQTWHFALIAKVSATDGVSADQLAALQTALRHNIDNQHRNPVYLRGKLADNRPETDPGVVDSVAANRPVTVSSSQGPLYPGRKAVDGDFGGRWSSKNADPQWLAVDLGQSRVIDQVRLYWEAAYARSYHIEVSSDGRTWATVFATAAGDGGLDVVGFTPVSARWVRMTGTQRGTRHGYSLWELQVFGR